MQIQSSAICSSSHTWTQPLRANQKMSIGIRQKQLFQGEVFK